MKNITYRKKFLASLAIALGLSLSPNLSVAKEPVAELSGKKEKGEVSSRAPTDFSQIVKPLLPSVVNISTSTDLSSQRRFPENGRGGHPLEELFRQFLEEQRGGGRPRKTSSLGSGFVIEQNGQVAFIVTCNHVIAEADEIKVIFHDGDEVKAELVGTDARTDLALVKVKVDKKLALAPWGDSTKSEVGNWVIAIGNPFGLSSTVTTGIVSTTRRDIAARSARGQGFADYVDGYIQTDASINMGNSGGPMFNIQGEVIAISTAIFSPNGGNIGIGFGIPSDLAKRVIAQLKKFGRTKRGWLGVRVQGVTKEIASSLGLENDTGALVGDISPQSPAGAAGIKTGDIILKFDGKVVEESQYLPRLVGETEIESKVPVVVWRDGKEVTLQVKIGEFEQAEEDGLIDIQGDRKPTSKKDFVLGLAVKPVKKHLCDIPGGADKSKKESKTSQSEGDKAEKGLIIVAVDPRSEAAEKGLRPGDIIAEVKSAKEKVIPKSHSELDDFISKARKEDRKQALFLISRGGNLLYVTLGIAKE